MRIHNHRMAMNTRIANRFGVNKLRETPITPSENLAIGDPYECEYDFNAVSRYMVVMIALKATGSFPQANFHPKFEGATIIDYHQTVRYHGVGSPYIISYTLDCVTSGGNVKMIMPNAPEPRQLMNGWTMVQAFGVDYSGEGSPIVKHAVSANAISVSTTMAVFGTNQNTVGVQSISMIINNAYHRGKPIPTTGFYAKVLGEVNSGYGIDNPPMVPNEVTGGWYCTAVFENHSGGATGTTGTIGFRWNRADGAETEKYWYSHALIELKAAARLNVFTKVTFTDHITSPDTTP